MPSTMSVNTISDAPGTRADPAGDSDYGGLRGVDIVTGMATISDHVTAVRRDGYTIIRDVFSADEASDYIAELDRLERDLRIQPAANTFEGHATWRIYNLLNHGALFAQIPVHPIVLPVVEGVLDQGLLISSLSSIVIGPGESAQPIHADDQVMPLAKPHAALVCNTMWALTDFTEANGATRIMPGTHLADHSPEYGASFPSIAAEMERGSVLVWHGSLWHGGGANTTRERRYGIAMNYCAGWVRQQENQQLGIPLEALREFKPRLQELCGFGTYKGLIGHIDRQTPAQRVFHAPARPMLFDVT
jgi:ectoine hydroxylase-related dioxygenase (phytanoyl-CoA dioxygenase family)